MVMISFLSEKPSEIPIKRAFRNSPNRKTSLDDFSARPTLAIVEKRSSSDIDLA